MFYLAHSNNTKLPPLKTLHSKPEHHKSPGVLRQPNTLQDRNLVSDRNTLGDFGVWFFLSRQVLQHSNVLPRILLDLPPWPWERTELLLGGETGREEERPKLGSCLGIPSTWHNWASAATDRSKLLLGTQPLMTENLPSAATEHLPSKGQSKPKKAPFSEQPCPYSSFCHHGADDQRVWKIHIAKQRTLKNFVKYIWF